MQYVVEIGIEPPDDGERSGVSANQYCSSCINATTLSATTRDEGLRKNAPKYPDHIVMPHSALLDQVELASAG